MIEFACGCGKQFRVKDELAGKRTKCPACAAVLAVPEKEKPAASAEDDAFRMLAEDGESDPEPRPVRHDRAGQVEPSEAKPALPKPASPPPKRKAERIAVDEEPAPRRGISLSPAVAGGLASMAICGVIMAVSLSSGRIPIGAIIVFIFGFVAVVQGLLGYSED